MLSGQFLYKKFLLGRPEFSKFEHLLLDQTLLLKKRSPALISKTVIITIKDLTRKLREKPDVVLLLLV